MTTAMVEHMKLRRQSVKRLIFVGGLPGSGKTTFARYIAQETGGFDVAADDFFTRGGDYKFEPAKLADAHKWCQDYVRWEFNQGDFATIVVHNTGSRRWEREVYREIAEQAGAEYTEIFVNTNLTDEELAARNVHGVPANVIKKMRERWEF